MCLIIGLVDLVASQRSMIECSRSGRDGWRKASERELRLTVSGTAPVLPQSTMCCHKAPLAISRGGRSEALGRSLCVIRVGIHQW